MTKITPPDKLFATFLEGAALTLIVPSSPDYFISEMADLESHRLDVYIDYQIQQLIDTLDEPSAISIAYGLVGGNHSAEERARWKAKVISVIDSSSMRVLAHSVTSSYLREFLTHPKLGADIFTILYYTN